MTRSLALLVSLVACGDGDGEPDVWGLDGSRGRDVGVDADPHCHWDCGGASVCEDGVVYEIIHAPVPCYAWGGSCPREEIGRCADGCSERAPTDVSTPRWESFCRGTEERLVGDPCESDADCQPPAPAGRDRVYLGCDAGSCVVVDPVTVPDRGVACEADLSGYAPEEGSVSGVTRDPSCGGGWCRFNGDECHGCAVPCEDDWDCEPDQWCHGSRDWTGRTRADGAGPEMLFCSTRSIDDTPCR